MKLTKGLNSMEVAKGLNSNVENNNYSGRGMYW